MTLIFKRLSKLILVSLSLYSGTGCKKSFLDKKPATDILVPSTISDFRKLLEYTDRINQTPGLPQLASDEYYVDSTTWQASTSSTQRNSYIWAQDIFGGEAQRLDWNRPYFSVFNANCVLNGLNSITRDNSNQNDFDDTKGWALFVRAYAFFNLAKSFSPVYDSLTAATDLGIPIRLTPNIDEIAQRSSVKETYDRILSDLNEASLLLSPTFPAANRNRPWRAAAHALFARIYLSMRKYDKAEFYVDKCLQVYDTLLDYNTGPPTIMNNNTPFAINTPESIFWSTQVYNYGFTSYRITPGFVDSNLIKSYASNDLRLSRKYFIPAGGTPGKYKPKNGYSPSGLYPYSGLATNEMYLIKSECLARRDMIAEAMNTLNKLLRKRHTNTFINLTASSRQEALSKIFTERRKELVWTGLRWDDLRRLNKEGITNVTLQRILNGQLYTLPPNDPRYTFPIPDDEIALSGIQQNIR